MLNFAHRSTCPRPALRMVPAHCGIPAHIRCIACDATNLPKSDRPARGIRQGSSANYR